jgi:hypothetical protein
MAAGLVLVFFWMLGLAVLRGLWNPYAVVLPAVLFLLLAAGAMVGRPGWGLGAALAGTFVVQTHVGTAALVGLTGLLVVVTRAAVWGRRAVGTRRLPRVVVPTGRGRLVGVSGVAVLVLAWLPPLIDQISGTGNLHAVYAFVRQAKPSLGWAGSGSVVGQLLNRVYASRDPARLEALLPASGGMRALFVVAGLAVGLLVVGWRRADAGAAAGGGVVMAGLVGAVVGAHGIVGPRMPYLLLWTAALPVTLSLGWAALLAGASRAGPGAVASLRVPAAVLTTTAAAAMAVVAIRLPAVSGFPEPVLAQAAAELPRQLAGQGLAPQAILVRPCGAGRWPAAAGLVLELRRRGWPAYVPDAFVPVFGARRRLPGRAHVEVIVASHLTGPAVARLPGSRPLSASPVESWGLFYRLSEAGFSGSPGPEPAGRVTEACRRT